MCGRGTNPWRSAIVAVIVATTDACISSGRYPADWTEPVPMVDHDCPDVSGVYSNRGEVQPGVGDASLNLFLRPGIPLLAVTEVEIARSDRFLDISLWSDGKVSERRRLERGVGFECGPKGLELLERGYSSADSAINVGASFSWGKVWMSRGEDRSLVVHTVDNDLAILILVPLYGRQALWYRFPAVEGADGRQDRGVVSAAPVPGVGEAARSAALDEVIARTIESSGGSDAWNAVESARITGRMVRLFDGKQGSFSLEVKRPNKWRREFAFKGGTEITTFDGEAGWLLRAKRTKPMPMKKWISLSELEVPFFGPLLLDYNAEGDNIELVSEEDVGGTAAYKIKVTRDSGDVDRIDVDAERFLVFRLDRKALFHAWLGNSPSIIERETFVGNYKRVGAVMFPHTLEVRQNGLALTMTVDRVELNPGIGDDRFAMPQVSR
jgi:hypothetical protein